MSDSDYVNAESSEGSESNGPVRERPSNRVSVDTVGCAAVHVVDAPGVAVAAPVLDGDMPAPVTVAAAAAVGRGRGRGLRGRGHGAQGGRLQNFFRIGFQRLLRKLRTQTNKT